MVLVEELSLLRFPVKVEILEPLLLINDSCEAKVLLVAVVNNDMFVLAVVIKPNVDVKFELIFDTEVFNDEMLVVCVY